jgi:hypothetical protein
MGKTSELYIQLQDELINTIHQIDNGELSHLDALIEMRKHRKAAEMIIEITKDFEQINIDKIAELAEQYGGNYKGHEIKHVNGRTTYECKGIPEYDALSVELKKVADKYKSAFIGVQKGIVQTTNVDGATYWVDENGELHPLPEIKITKSYITVGSANQL